MASPSTSSSNILLTSTVPQEEFKTFHNIDRIVYSRLVLTLDYNPKTSMQIMGLFLWLERASHVRDFVYKILSFPDTLINSLAIEAILCLNCIENNQFIFSSHDDIPLIHYFTKTKLSLQFFHQNRPFILGAVSKIVHQVCERAFQDINLLQAEKLRKGFDFYGGNLVYSHNHHMGNLGFVNNNNLGTQNQGQISNHEITDMLSNIQICSISDDEQKEKEDNASVPVDDRTIFLTFSKGYPISEDEVRDFFMRKYGACIEAIHMQEVSGEDQPLYARLVVYSPTIIQIVLEGKSKAKFSINGKHVWARKYVRKNAKSSSSPTQPSSPSQPTSPSTP